MDVEVGMETRPAGARYVEIIYWIVPRRRNEGGGRVVSRNFYRLSAEAETLDWDRTEWYYTPTKTYADYTAVDQLEEVALEVSRSFEDRGSEQAARVRVKNPTKSLGFAVRLRVLRASDGEEALPVLWEGNYFALMPGEEREVRAVYP